MTDITPAMIQAGLKVLMESGAVDALIGCDEILVSNIFQAMIAANGKPVDCLECHETFFVENGSKRADAKFCCQNHRIKFKNRRYRTLHKAAASMVSG